MDARRTSVLARLAISERTGMLHEFVTAHRAEIIARCRAKISSRPAPRATDVELEYGVPMFLDQLTERLRIPRVTNPEIGTHATKHATELLLRGFTIAQVVHDYSGIHESITEISEERSALITPEEHQTLHACLDEATAGAVTEYARVRAFEGTAHLGRLAHDLRNQLNTALLSYEMLKMGRLEISSSTGSVLGRSLSGLRNLLDRELAEARLGTGLYDCASIVVAELIEDVEVPAAMEAEARGLQFSVVRVGREVTVNGDRHILEAVIANLLQNAFKFSVPAGLVTLRTHTIGDRVLIDIEDQCGGLPADAAEQMFAAPAPGAGKRKGVGLDICARGARVNNGRIHVRDQPGAGCTFSFDLPRELPLNPAAASSS